jgi:hypothetical protein
VLIWIVLPFKLRDFLPFDSLQLRLKFGSLFLLLLAGFFLRF